MNPARHTLRSFGTGIRKLATLLVGIALLCGSPARASGEGSTPNRTEQDQTSTKAYLTLGLGGSTVGILALANLSLETGSLLLSARASATATFEPAFLPDTESRPSKIDVTDYSVLAGKTWLRDGTRFYVEAGPGVAKVTRRGDQVFPGSGETFSPYYKMSSDKVANLAFQAGAREDWSSVGVGLAIVGNVNSGVSEVGLALTVSLGKMRD